ncbi:MAG: Gfo/Idh/MocA family oxidoreductase, partial [Acidobacteriota bacterium]|nr:Gfo/Idh/MocA family oxidoreductase [Acidobacteriota bacterium]
MAKLGVAVIGAGMLGRRHAENLRSKIAGARLVAVCDASLQRAKEVAAELEVECATDRIEEILGRKDVQAVAIATP